MGLSWAEETLEIEGSAEDCFDAITDFETYPRWQPATEEAEVLERDRKNIGKLVRYRVDAGIRKIGYVLSYEYERPGRLSWDSTEGQGVKRITGEYLFEEQDGRTRATIKLGADPGAGVPGIIARRLNKQRTRQSIEELKTEVERRAGQAPKERRFGRTAPAAEPGPPPPAREPAQEGVGSIIGDVAGRLGSTARAGAELPLAVAKRAGSIGIGAAESALGRLSKLLGGSDRDEEK